jgi:hypothetical protein
MLATSRNDILRDALTTEAQIMLNEGVALDHILAILPAAVEVRQFQQMLYDRVVAWALNHLEDNRYLDSDNPAAHMIKLEPWEKLERCSDNFWNEFADADYIRLAIDGDASFEKFKDQFIKMLDDGVLSKHLSYDDCLEIASNVTSTFRLCPQFDYDAAVVASHGYLIELWNELV